MQKKRAKRNRGYAAKKKSGVEANHDRHPASGIPWCSLCQKEQRANTQEEVEGGNSQ